MCGRGQKARGGFAHAFYIILFFLHELKTNSVIISLEDRVGIRVESEDYSQLLILAPLIRGSVFILLHSLRGAQKEEIIQHTLTLIQI